MKTYPRLVNAIQKLGYEHRDAKAAIGGHILARTEGKNAFATPLIRAAIRSHRQRQAASKPGYDFIKYRYAQSLRGLRTENGIH